MIKKILHIISCFSRRLNDNHVGAYAGQATLFIVISIFPFFMFLMTLIQYLPITQSNLMVVVNSLFPVNVSTALIRIISEAYSMGSTAVVSITAITTLWSASRGFLSLVKGLNVVYGIKETRSSIRLRAVSTIYTLVFALIIIITLIILVFGNRLYLFIESIFPVLKDTALLIISLRAVLGLTILTLFFLILFNAVPNRRGRFMAELPGSILAASGWMIFSYLFSYYIDNVNSFSNTYGSLTAIVLLMLWFYFCMYILFIGAEINVLLDSKCWKNELDADF